MSTTSQPGLEQALEMRAIIYGRLLSRAVCAAAELGIPDLLSDGPRRAAELADAVGARADLVGRLMQSLAAFDVFVEEPAGVFALTPLGATLRNDVPGSARPTALLAAGEFGQAWDLLTTTVRTGDPAFDTAFGTDMFSYLRERPALRELYDRSQAEGLQLELDGILDAVDLTGCRKLIDIGGGDGTLLASLLAHSPWTTGVLLDFGTVLPRAEAVLRAAGVADRCEVSTRNFFTDLPAGGDVYLMRHILHDWDDASCGRLLALCRRRMTAEGRLVVIDVLARAGALPAGRPAALMDLYMMAVLDGARERTEPELRELLRRAGFTVASISTTGTGACVLEARPTP